MQTTGSGSIRANDVWILEHSIKSRDNTSANVKALTFATWTSVVPSGVSWAGAAPRNNFAAVSVGVTVALFGGEGNAGTYNTLEHLDLCSSVQCGPGYRSNCDWNVTNSRRGACIPCKDEEYCCRASTYKAEEGICSGMHVTLNSCAQSNLQWYYLMQDASPRVFLEQENCINAVQSMCASVSAPGVLAGTARQNPLICQRAFLCASDSPYGTLKFNPTKGCGVPGVQCVGSVNSLFQRPNRVCCSYVEHLIEQSCNALPADFVAYLARSYFPTCSSTNCYSPAVFQITAIAMNHEENYNEGYVTTQGPSAREGVTAAVIGKSVFIYGGYTHSGEYSKELWELSADAYPPRWYDYTNVRGGPTIGRRHAAVASLEPASKMLVHGGEGPEYLLDDLYLLDIQRTSLDMPYMWIDLTNVMAGEVPLARCMHAMIGVGASEAYMFGGKTLIGVSDEVNMYVCLHVYIMQILSTTNMYFH